MAVPGSKGQSDDSPAIGEAGIAAPSGGPRRAGPGLEDATDAVYRHTLLRDQPETLLGVLAAAVDAPAGAIFDLGPTPEERVRARPILTLNVAPASERAYRESFTDENPLIRVCAAIPEGGVGALSESIPLESLRDSAFYRAVNLPSRIDDVLAFRVRGARPTAFGLFRPPGRPFEPETLALARALAPHLARAVRLRDAASPPADALVNDPRFTAKEREIMALLKARYRYADIAATCGFSRNTLKWHMQNIFGKTGVRSVAQLVARL